MQADSQTPSPLTLFARFDSPSRLCLSFSSSLFVWVAMEGRSSMQIRQPVVTLQRRLSCSQKLRHHGLVLQNHCGLWMLQSHQAPQHFWTLGLTYDPACSKVGGMSSVHFSIFVELSGVLAFLILTFPPCPY